MAGVSCAPALATFNIFSRFMVFSGVSLGTRISLRFSLRVTLAALWMRLEARPFATAARVFILHGIITIPLMGKLPEAMGASSWVTLWYQMERTSRPTRASKSGFSILSPNPNSSLITKNAASEILRCTCIPFSQSIWRSLLA